jgi:hypothetical protein
VKTYVYLWKYLAGFFSEWKIFRQKLLEKIEAHFYIIYRKCYRLWDNVEEYCKVGQATDGSTIPPMRFACWMIKDLTRTRNMSYSLLCLRQQCFGERLYTGRSITFSVITNIHNKKTKGPVMHTSNISSCQKIFSFPAAVDNFIKVGPLVFLL